MGHREKARQAVRALEFKVETRSSVAEVANALAEAAASAGPGGLRGTFKKATEQSKPDGFKVDYVFMGPGGVIKVMDLRFDCTTVDDSRRLSLTIGDFKYQKHVLGRVTINGGPQVERFESLVRQRLAA